MMSLGNEFLFSYCYMSARSCDVSCRGTTKEILREGKIILISLPSPLPADRCHPPAAARRPPGPPAGGTAGRGSPRLPGGDGPAVEPLRGLLGLGERVQGSGEGPASEGCTEAPVGCGRPAERAEGCGGRPCRPRAGISALRGRGGGGSGDRGDPGGEPGSTSPPRSPRPAAALSSPPAPSHPLDPAPGGSAPRRSRAGRMQAAAPR